MAFVLLALTPVELLKRHAKTLLYIGLGACALLFIAEMCSVFHRLLRCASAPADGLNLARWGVSSSPNFWFGMLLFLAGFLARRIQQGLINDLDKTIIPVAAVFGLAMLFIVVLQKDMGTGISLTAMVASMFVIGGVNRKIGGATSLH